MSAILVQPACPVPLPDWAASILALYAPPLRARGTFLHTRQALREFAALDGVATTADLTQANVARFAAASPGRAAATTNGLLASLRAACNLALAGGVISRSPFAGRSFMLREGEPRPPKFHARSAIRRVLARLATDASWEGRRLYALATLVAYCGLRRDEALRLRPRDFDLRRGFVFVVARRPLKTAASAAPVPIPRAARPVLGRWLSLCGPEWAFPGVRRAGPWTGGSGPHRAVEALKAAASAAGVEGFTFQSLRHSLATHLGTHWGLGEIQVKRILRHTTVATQRHYVHPDLVNLGAAVRGFDFGPRATSAKPAPRRRPARPSFGRRRLTA